MKIHIESEYASVIERFITRQFPLDTKPGATLLDLLTEAFLSTGNVRYGPRPSIESLAKIRQTISKYMNLDSPIPVLTPWGSRKIDNGLLDIAELQGLYQLKALARRINQFYPPGVRHVLGVEDLGGGYLWADHLKNLDGQALYVRELASLHKVLDLKEYGLELFLESSLASQESFSHSANFVVQHLYDVVLGRIPTPTLPGWRGGISREMIDWHVANAARANEPDPEFAAAKFLAQSFTRYQLRTKHPLDFPTDYVQVNLSLPIPGLDPALDLGRLHYRTMNAKHCKTHLAPWRGRGYFKIDASNDNLTPKIALSRDLPEDLRLCAMNLTHNDLTVTLRADYILT